MIATKIENRAYPQRAGAMLQDDAGPWGRETMTSYTLKDIQAASPGYPTAALERRIHPRAASSSCSCPALPNAATRKPCGSG